MIKKPGRSA